jgi:hypothetical protein
MNFSKLSQFLCKSIETWDLERKFFSKLQNGELNQDGVSNHCFVSFGSHTVISQPDFKMETYFLGQLRCHSTCYDKFKIGSHFKIG